MNALITPTLFPDISTFAIIAQAKKAQFEVNGNYQKQTYRNRMAIYGANGKAQLNAPVIYTQKERQLYKDVKLFNEDKWQNNHWKSFESAYKKSPFFEFYEDELNGLFTKQFDYILDYNLACFEIICECLQLDIETTLTTSFEKTPQDIIDYRHLAERKSKGFNIDTYTQVFNDKHGFIPNLSVLDLLFNEGPNALNYLESQKLTNAAV